MKKRNKLSKTNKIVIIFTLLLISLILLVWSNIEMCNYEGYWDIHKEAFSSVKGKYYTGLVCIVFTYFLSKKWK